MSANLTAALQISVIGMSFVLAALVLLWLVIAVLVRLTAEPSAPPPEPAAAPPADATLRQRAAAIAVAVALATQPPSAARPMPAKLAPQLSPWQAARRTQLLKQRERHR